MNKVAKARKVYQQMANKRWEFIWRESADCPYYTGFLLGEDKMPNQIPLKEKQRCISALFDSINSGHSYKGWFRPQWVKRSILWIDSYVIPPFTGYYLHQCYKPENRLLKVWDKIKEII